MELTMPEWNRVVKRQYRTTKEFKNLDAAVQRFIILKNNKPELRDTWEAWIKKFTLLNRTYKDSMRWTAGCALDAVYIEVTPPPDRRIEISNLRPAETGSPYNILPGNNKFVAAHVKVPPVDDRGMVFSGWKLHISAYWYNAEDIAKVVLPLLCQKGIWHKYAKSPKILGDMTDEDAGKFITIYTCKADEKHPEITQLVDELNRRLGRFTGPKINGEESFGQLVYGRRCSNYAV